MGNAVVWKPASSAMYSAYYLMKLYQAAGMPPGVINMVAGDASVISKALLCIADLAGVHFTGSTEVFNDMWKTIGASMSSFRSYPRIVGETGGKDFILGTHRPILDALAVASFAVDLNFRDRNARPPAASTCRAHSGTPFAIAWWR